MSVVSINGRSRETRREARRRATHVTMWVRGSFPSTKPTRLHDAERSLSEIGYSHCKGLSEEYRELFKKYQRRFGSPSFISANDMVSIASAIAMLQPDHLVTDARLGKAFDLRTIDDGAWYAQRSKSHTFCDMLEDVFSEPDVLDQPTMSMITQVRDLLFDPLYVRETRFRVMVGHEALFSLAVAEFDDDEHPLVKLGLFTGQAFVLYHDDVRVYDMYRFEPRSTKNMSAASEDATQAIAS